MSRDKQMEIEEMAKAVCHLDRTCDECMTSFECKAMTYAKRFYEAGYRKSTKLAEEIFEEIEKLIALNSYQGDVFTGRFLSIELEDDIAELKKKYESEKDNG